MFKPQILLNVFFFACLIGGLAIYFWPTGESQPAHEIRTILTNDSLTAAEQIEQLAPFVRVGDNLQTVQQRILNNSKRKWKVDRRTEFGVGLGGVNLTMLVESDGRVLAIGKHIYEDDDGTVWLTPRPGEILNINLRTELQEVTLLTLRLACGTDRSPVMDQAVGEVDPIFLRHRFHQFFFDLHGIRFVGQAQPASQAADVGVDDDAAGDSKRGAQDDVRCFASHPRQCDQFVEFLRDFAVVLVDQGLGGGVNVLRFVAEETGRLDDLLELGDLGFGHCFGVGVLGEEILGDDVDPHVGALGREDRGDQKLIRRIEVERALGVGIVLLQLPHYRGGPGLCARRDQGASVYFKFEGRASESVIASGRAGEDLP